MSYSFENIGTHTYFVYEIEETDQVDTMSLGMLTNNQIPGLAAAIFTQADEKKYIKYDISAKVSVEQFFSGAVNKKRLLGVFEGITDAMLSAEDYMLDMNSILLDLEYIFADVSTCKAVLICLPIVQEEKGSNDLGSFFKEILFRTQFDQTEDGSYVARILSYLNSTPIFSLSSFKKLLIDIRNDPEKPAGTSAEAQGAPVAPAAVSPSAVSPSVVRSESPVQMVSPAPPVPPAPPAAPVQNVQPVVQSAEIVNVVPAPADFKQEIVMPEKSKKAVGKKRTEKKANPKAEKKPASEEREMTVLSLLTHYSKENAALYKQQKAAKGSKQTEKKTGFAVPGQTQAVPVSVAPPAQTSPASMPTARPAQASPASTTTARPAPQTVPAPVPTPAQTVQARPMAQSAPAENFAQPVQAVDFGQTTVLGTAACGQTTVLDAQSGVNAMIPHLVRKSTAEKILIDKPMFKIGKEKNYVDYCIGDNPAISRSHAVIISREGQYYLSDTNSTNHTFLNGMMLKSNTEAKLEHGALIKLANEEFEFRLY